MSEEEKKALEYFKALDKLFFEPYLSILLNLFDKQQEEIEELKDKNKTLESLLQGNLYEMYLYYKELAGKYQANCISKDTIRTKIEELEKEGTKQYWTENVVKMLRQLLEE